MSSSQIAATFLSAARLRSQVAGEVVFPGDAGYDAARSVYFSAIDRRPAVIVRAASVEDVARVVGLAHESGVELAVRSGGHSLAAHGVCDDGIVLDLSGLRTLEIDRTRRVARAGAGIPAGEYTNAAAAHGLVTGFGDAPTVAVGGITLSGGVGYLHRKFGMTIDSLVGAEVVTADGRVVRADAVSNPDLFWAIRGGGGNFGVVTRFDLRLQPLGTVLGGMLVLPATARTLVEFLATADNAPDELGVICMVMPAPPMPFIPAERHGTPIIMALLVYAGDPVAGAAAVAPFRALATPLADLVRPMAYPEMYQGEAGPHPAAFAVHSRFIESLDEAHAGALLERLVAGTAPMRVAQFRPLGGALARVPAAATAFAHRDRRFIVNIAAACGTLAEVPAYEAWTTSVAAELGESRPGVYSAFLGANGGGRIREAYPGPTWDRLVAIKRRYDPDNLFRGNQNIPPIGAR